MKKIFMDDKHLAMVKDIIGKYPYNFYVFGSRAVGNPRELSDLDLCITEDVPGDIMSHMEEDFIESDLPYEVDMVLWNKISESFRQLIKDDLTCIQDVNKKFK